MILLIYINYMSAASVGSLRHSHTDSDKVDAEQLNEVEAVNLLFLFPVSSLSSLSLSVRTFTASLPFTSSLFLFPRDQNRNESSAVLDVH